MDGEGRIAIHMTHRFGAIVVALYLGFLIYRLTRRELGPQLRSSGLTLAALLTLQLTLGLSNVWWSLPLAVAVAHNAGGALLLLALITLNYRLHRATKLW